jgi:hypothetical protein
MHTVSEEVSLKALQILGDHVLNPLYCKPILKEILDILGVSVSADSFSNSAQSAELQVPDIEYVRPAVIAHLKGESTSKDVKLLLQLSESDRNIVLSAARMRLRPEVLRHCLENKLLLKWEIDIYLRIPTSVEKEIVLDLLKLPEYQDYIPQIVLRYSTWQKLTDYECKVFFFLDGDTRKKIVKDLLEKGMMVKDMRAGYKLPDD